MQLLQRQPLFGYSPMNKSALHFRQLRREQSAVPLNIGAMGVDPDGLDINVGHHLPQVVVANYSFAAVTRTRRSASLVFSNAAIVVALTRLAKAIFEGGRGARGGGWGAVI
jgi:hypothetical protein